MSKVRLDLEAQSYQPTEMPESKMSGVDAYKNKQKMIDASNYKRRRIIYFIQVGTRGPIKIGISLNRFKLQQRLSVLQQQNPYPLRIIRTEFGTFKKEKQLHKRFAQLWIRYEWFKPKGELAKYLLDRAEKGKG